MTRNAGTRKLTPTIAVLFTLKFESRIMEGMMTGRMYRDECTGASSAAMPIARFAQPIPVWKSLGRKPIDRAIRDRTRCASSRLPRRPTRSGR
jgi:hypothetical protein